MLSTAVAVSSRSSAGEALAVLENTRVSTAVLVWHRWPEIDYLVMTVEDFRRVLAGGAPDRNVIAVLQPSSWQRARVFDVATSSADDLLRARGVLLDGATVIGVLAPAPSDAIGTASRGEPTRGGPTRGESTRGGPTRGAPLRRGGGGDAVPAPPPSPSAAEAPAASDDVTAYPWLDGPRRVEAGAEVILTVGLSDRPSSTGDEPMILHQPADQPDLELTVIVIAPGFRGINGLRRQLTVPREALDAQRIDVRLVADEVPGPERISTIVVEYWHRGTLGGRAWREISVVRPGAGTAPAPLVGGATGIRTPPDELAPDLTVSIDASAPGADLYWTFMTSVAIDPDRTMVVAPPDGEWPIRWNCGADGDTLLFAQALLDLPPKLEGRRMVVDSMQGMGAQIAEAMPPEFFATLAAVLAAAKALGRPATVLFVSSDPYVPWDLAWLGQLEELFPPDLMDADKPVFIGAQSCVGRWVHPQTRQPRGVHWPLLPPPTSTLSRDFVVLAGDYRPESGLPALEHAVDEAEQLVAGYDGVPLQAAQADVRSLVRDEVTYRGRVVEAGVVHFACHGERDFTDVQYNGIVLDDGSHLDASIVAGEVALRLYEAVFTQGRSVADVLRDIRGAFVETDREQPPSRPTRWTTCASCWPGSRTTSASTSTCSATAGEAWWPGNWRRPVRTGSGSSASCSSGRRTSGPRSPTPTTWWT